jgi:CzcA family heavy metal efflux pump
MDPQRRPDPELTSTDPQPRANLARFALRNSRGILLTVVFISLLGGLMLTRMPAAILPDFPYPRLEVIVHAGDLAIQDMVVRVTRPLEAAAAGVPGAKIVRSHTSRGAIEMSVDFNWGTDMFEAYTRLNAFVAAIRSQLPAGVDVQIEWIQPSIFPIIGISLSSDRVSLRELRDHAQLTVAPYLSRLEGVYRANALGGQVREYQVLVDPQALAEQSLTMDEVNRALTAANLVRSVGRFNRHAQSFLVLLDAQVPRPERLLDTVITTRGARVVRIGDVATVREGDEELTHAVVAGYRDPSGRPITREAVQIDIFKQPGASTAQVWDEVRAALDQLREQLPAGAVIHTFYNEADLLRESQASLRDSILLGGLLAMLVLLLVLRSWRSMAIVLVCLPITTLLAFGCLKLLGQTLNLMTLGGLAVGLGLIIDDVVVTLENIYRHLELGKPPLQAAIDGAGEIQKPMIGSTLTAVAVFLPLSFLGEIIGGLFSPLSVTLVILLLGSVLLAVTLVPLLCALLLRPLQEATSIQGSEVGSESRMLNTYDRVIRGALAAPGVVIVGAVLLAICGLAAFRSLSSGLMPEMDESAFVMDYLAPAGTPLEETDAACRVMEQEIMATPEVEGFCRRTGLELGFFVTDTNTGDNMIRLKPRSQRDRSTTEVMEEILERCRKRLPGMEFEVFPPIVDRVQDIAGEPSPVEAKIFGEDPKVLLSLAEQVEKVFAEVKGVEEGAHEITPSGPELVVRVDPIKAGLLGLSPEDVARNLELSLFGRVETYAPRGDRLIGLRAVYPKEARRTETQIRRLPVSAKDGRVVTLEEIADIREEPGVFAVVRENQKQVMPVTGTINPQETDLGTANREVQRRIRQEIHLPPGYSIQYGGLYFTQQQSFQNLLQVLLLGALLVYIVTLFQYNRFAEPTSLVLAGAFALVGVAAALFLTRTPFNVSSFTGAIMIFGMVMTNGIVLMDTVQTQVAAGWPLDEAIVRAGRQRLRPVLMTASIAMLTLLPLAFGIGSGAEMQRPLAIAVIGGLATSPLFTLVLAPTLLYLARRRQPQRGGDGK